MACSGKTAGMGAEVFKDRAILRVFTLPKVNSKVCLLKQIIVIMEKLRALFTLCYCLLDGCCGNNVTVLLFVKNRRQIFCVGCVVDEKKREKSEMNFNDEVFGKCILNLSE